jgi:hypothetical protein
MDNSELRNEILRRHLGPTTAPCAIWRNLMEVETKPKPSHHMAWATATAVLILFAMWGLRSPVSSPAAARSPQVSCNVCHV